jgi:hypothetical protein
MALTTRAVCLTPASQGRHVSALSAGTMPQATALARPRRNPKQRYTATHGEPTKS